jgi:hemoglobin-like flavoprotein
MLLCIEHEPPYIRHHSSLQEYRMHALQIELVQSSFARVEPIADTAATLFYTRLFELNPSLRLMFKGNMVEQGHKLMTTLKVVVNGLTRLEALVPAVQALGRRHASYGVTDEHYDTVADALLWTLQQGLGEYFTPDVAAAWCAAYGILADVMKAAAAEVDAAMVVAGR